MAVTEAGHHLSRWYGDQDGCLHLNGATFYIDGTTTNNNIVLTDNLADALNIKEGSSSYLKFVTTNSGEKIVAGKAVELATTLTFNGATGVNKILMQDNLASGLVIGEASNSYITFVTTNSSEGISVGKTITMADATNIAVDTTTGTKIGTATSQKIGFWNATPVIQQASAAQAAVTPSTDFTGADTVDKATVLAAVQAVETLVNRLRLDLVTVGIIKGAA